MNNSMNAIEHETHTSETDGIEVTEALYPIAAVADDLEWLMRDCMSTPYAEVQE